MTKLQAGLAFFKSRTITQADYDALHREIPLTPQDLQQGAIVSMYTHPYYFNKYAGLGRFIPRGPGLWNALIVALQTINAPFFLSFPILKIFSEGLGFYSHNGIFSPTNNPCETLVLENFPELNTAISKKDWKTVYSLLKSKIKADATNYYIRVDNNLFFIDVIAKSATQINLDADALATCFSQETNESILALLTEKLAAAKINAPHQQHYPMMLDLMPYGTRKRPLDTMVGLVSTPLFGGSFYQKTLLELLENKKRLENVVFSNIKRLTPLLSQLFYADLEAGREYYTAIYNKQIHHSNATLPSEKTNCASFVYSRVLFALRHSFEHAFSLLAKLKLIEIHQKEKLNSNNMWEFELFVGSFPVSYNISTYQNDIRNLNQLEDSALYHETERLTTELIGLLPKQETVEKQNFSTFTTQIRSLYSHLEKLENKFIELDRNISPLGLINEMYHSPLFKTEEWALNQEKLEPISPSLKP